MTKAKLLKISEFPYREFDSNGNLIYHEDLDGTWYRYEYDSLYNEIGYENSYGKWAKQEFNILNKKIFYEDSNGVKEKFDYDSNGNEIFYENKRGYGYFKYYEDNKLVYEIKENYKFHYINYKRNLFLNHLLND